VRSKFAFWRSGAIIAFHERCDRVTNG
jgi:hypothetical protein